jgi:hypothetical protein
VGRVVVDTLVVSEGIVMSLVVAMVLLSLFTWFVNMRRPEERRR